MSLRSGFPLDKYFFLAKLTKLYILRLNTFFYSKIYENIRFKLQLLITNRTAT